MKLARSLFEYLERRLGAPLGSGPEYVFHCPACLEREGSESNKRKFALNIDNHRGRCFRCDFKFRSMESLFRYMNRGTLTVEERVLLRKEPPLVSTSVLATVTSILARDVESSSVSAPKPERLLREFEPLHGAGAKRKTARRALTYLEGRGVSAEEIERFDLRYASTGRYAGYIIFPVRVHGEQVYWTSRYAGEHPRGIKSQNPPKAKGNYSRRHCLLNFDAVFGASFVTLVEGPFDTMAARNGLGTLGVEVSDAQFALIESLVEAGLEELCLGYDPGSGKQQDKVRARLADVVPKISDLGLTFGDVAARRSELRRLYKQRKFGDPSIARRVGARLSRK